MIATGTGEAKTARDGRRWTLRPARPTDGRGLARLFADVRSEGRWLITAPGAVSEPSESFWISEMIRAAEHLVLVAEADGEVVGNILVSVDRGVATEHIGVLSITIADGWRDVGIGTELVETAQRWAARARPAQALARRLPRERARDRGVREARLRPRGPAAHAVPLRHGLPRRGADGLVPPGVACAGGA